MSTTKSSKINSRTHNGIVFMLIGMIISTISWAETVKTVNGTDIDSLVLDIYIQSRTQQAATEATPDQRLLYLDELTDIYLLSTQESAIQLSQNPQIKAQIELQNRGLIAQAVASDFCYCKCIRGTNSIRIQSSDTGHPI